MQGRFVSIWFRYLDTDWFSIRQPGLRKVPFVLKTSDHGRMVVAATNEEALKRGLYRGMPLADARAILPDLAVQDYQPDLCDKLLKRIALWCIRFTPIVAVDAPDGLFFDASGCTHLWGGEELYINDIRKKLSSRGFNVRLAIADTPGAAWAVARFGKDSFIIPEGKQLDALLSLPPEALRLEPETVERLYKLGLQKTGQLLKMPRTSLRRKFGQHFLRQLDMAMGQEMEILQPVQPVESYHERLPCLEPIVTAKGIEIALDQLLQTLCLRLQQEQKGLRKAIFKGYRMDGKMEQIDIQTNRPSHHVPHLFKLFEIRLSSIEPGSGIELFILEAPQVEGCIPQQEKIWQGSGGLEDIHLSELLDRLASKIGMGSIHRFIPAEHYWPERSFQSASLQEKLSASWPTDKQRPLHLLKTPESIEVTAPIPDYPPLHFRHKGKLHEVAKADGPERIEQEWWIQQGEHRDYYCVEDKEGYRYWIYRSGHYQQSRYQWFLHGFFA
jgi:protein ImuB